MSFQVVYRQPPPPLLSYAASTARKDTVNHLLREHDNFLRGSRSIYSMLSKSQSATTMPTTMNWSLH